MRFMRIAAILFATILVTGNVLAQDEVIARAYRTVNVRNGPGTQYDIIGQLNSGNEVQITGRSDDDSDWLRVDFQGSEGWVAYFTVTLLGVTDSLPIVSPLISRTTAPVLPASTPTVASSQLYITAYRTVNVRSGPGIEYVPIGNLEAESTADVTGRTSDNEWLQIDFGGQSGWVGFFTVSLTGELDDLETIDAPIAAVTEIPESNTIEVSTRYNVNLHQSPALSSPVIAIVPFSTSLQADARSDENGSWLRVIDNGQSGWLIATLVDAKSDIGDLPIDS